MSYVIYDTEAKSVRETARVVAVEPDDQEASRGRSPKAIPWPRSGSVARQLVDARQGSPLSRTSEKIRINQF